jgi:hypothetical protein
MVEMMTGESEAIAPPAEAVERTGPKSNGQGG